VRSTLFNVTAGVCVRTVGMDEAYHAGKSRMMMAKHTSVLKPVCADSVYGFEACHV